MKRIPFFVFLSCFLLIGTAFAGPKVHRTGVNIMPPMEIAQNVETLSGTKTLVVTDKSIQKLDPNGSDRDVVLPAEASSTDLVFYIYNTANGAGEDLVVKNDGGSTIVTLGPGMGMMFSCDGTTWLAMDDEGITYDAQADTHSFGTSAVTLRDLTVQGLTGAVAILNLIADAAEDDPDSWRIVVADSGDMTIESYQSGSWVAVLTIDNTGNVTVTSVATSATSAPSFSFYSSDAAVAGRAHGKIYLNLIDTGDGSEDADMIFQTIYGGSLTTFGEWDAQNQSYIRLGLTKLGTDAGTAQLNITPQSAIVGSLIDQNNAAIALKVESINIGTDLGGGQIRTVTTVNASTYNLLVTDYILNVTYTDTGVVAIDLKTAQTVAGRIIHIKDADFNAGTNNITITTEGGETIDEAATYVITANGNAVSLYSDGSNWFIF